MAIHKEHKEFFKVALGKGWETPEGYPRGIEQQILAGFLDEKGKRGNRTRHLRFAPGVYTTEPFVHDYWEEVYLVQGDLVVGVLAWRLQSQALALLLFGVAMAGALAVPLLENTWLRRWPRYLPATRDAER